MDDDAIQLSDKLAGLRVLWHMRIAGPVYGSIPPVGVMATEEVREAVQSQAETVEEIRQMLGQVGQLSLSLTDSLSDRHPTHTLLDGLRQSKKELAVFDQPLNVRFELFKANYAESNHALEVWQPTDTEAFPTLTTHYKNQLLPAIRNFPHLKAKIKATETPDVELYKLLLRRYSSKAGKAGRTSTGLRGQPKSVRKLSKHRELRIEAIPELVGFMPKLSAFPKTAATQLESNRSGDRLTEEGDDDDDFTSDNESE
ncbi:hypothetical protein GNI_059840 [Gregarina niphandrodes]|uniref:Uncharacterized protein n=1 Tax=Gregarina niphandrodes TaxID=110365 RepID=A0A023B8F4_GRENI|nr:hypothetical protein GNI_059840 [Gregarina niphandrodes]EZG69111.1 hypothetical protein GNI_059840 [Gregarina niphandrodes]|eukprot:XP_011134491.1 hypothetical protein GNI_059840 [Gregarina niphandrodes]